MKPGKVPGVHVRATFQQGSDDVEGGSQEERGYTARVPGVHVRATFQQGSDDVEGLSHVKRGFSESVRPGVHVRATFQQGSDDVEGILTKGSRDLFVADLAKNHGQQSDRPSIG